MVPGDRRQDSPVQSATASDGELSPVPAETGSSPDIEADILSEACRQGVGEPVAIHVHPAVYDRMRRAARPAGRRKHLPLRASRIPFVVDDNIPAAPGYEIHRARPGKRAC